MASLIVGVVLAVLAFAAVVAFTSSTGVGSSTFPAAFKTWRFIRGLFFVAAALVFLSSGMPSLMLIGVIMIGLVGMWYVFIRNDGDVDVSPR